MTHQPLEKPPYRIVIRNSALTRTGELDRLTSLTLTPRFNAVGGFELVLPLTAPKANLLVKGGWVQVLSHDGEVTSGQIHGLKIVEDDGNVGGTLTAYGPTSDHVIADRLAYQVPGSAASSQSADDYDNRSGTGETVIKQYVDVNAGPGALAARRITGLVVEADQARGASVMASARMTNLLDLISPLAQTAGLGFRVVITASDELEFGVYVPEDKTGSAKFGLELGNLLSYEQTSEAAKTNCAIVGGQGEGTARVFREINDTAAQSEWVHRTETFVDRRDTSNTTELDQAGTEEVVTNGPVSGLSIKTMDTSKLLFHRDYFLGDKVSIPRANVSDILREVEITWTATGGPQVTSTVGSASATGTLRMIRQLERLNAKVADLEARQ